MNLNPLKRLGMSSGADNNMNYNSIKIHPYFKDVDFYLLENQCRNNDDIISIDSDDNVFN